MNEKGYSLLLGDSLFSTEMEGKWIRDFVSKKVENGKTFTQIRMLNEEDKVCEIAKMIGGDNLSDVAIDNSREMVKLADIKKKEIKNEFI